LLAGDAGIKAGSRITALRWYVQAWFAEEVDRSRLSRRIAAARPAVTPQGERMLVREVMPRNHNDSTLLALLQWDTENGSEEKNRPDSMRRTKSTVQIRETMRIAAALPLRQTDERRAAIVRDLRDGMLAGLDVHRRKQNNNRDAIDISFELIDSTDKDSLRHALTRLERDQNALLLFGGAFSDDADRVCRNAAERGMLVLVPMATAEDLTEYGTNIFQLNIPILQRARFLADYAALELNASKAFILAPDHSYAREMAETFIARCGIVGIEVLQSVYYDKSAQGIKDLCRSLSQHDVKNGILFAPVQHRHDIVAVLEGIRETSLTMPIIGGGNWNHPDLLKRMSHEITLYFETDVVTDSSTAEYRLLRDAFAGRSSRMLTREALFGYDAMKIALEVTDKKPYGRKSTRKRIVNVFEGLRAPVNFLHQRVNAAMNMMLCRDGTIRRLEPFHAK
ncbi:MAG: amino acid ABC transporter substrate-binding protein, partial [Bacteroidetes bacterium]|nr:amino acid ABC transporter substrate-binding protein [Bacteroidota bacterium]